MTESVAPAATAGRSESDVRGTVRAMVVELSPARDESAGPDTHLVEGLGYHSLSLVELAFTLEDEFDLPPIDEPTARAITTGRAVEDHVVGVLSGRGEIVAGEIVAGG
jgi:acyl carrier protein